MINLNSNNRNFKKLSEEFFKTIKSDILSKISDNKVFLNKYNTDKTKTKFGDFLEKKIEDIITLPLNELLPNFEAELKKLFSDNYIIIEKTATKPKHDSEFKKKINQILFYEAQDTWKAYQLALDIASNTCAYCNRTYITTLGNDSKKFVRGDFDHFLAKSKYPYFRFSFFNLIPCCVICNRNAKSDDETSLDDNIYPYTEGFGNKTIFTYLPKNYEEIIGKGNPEIDFLILGDSKHKKKSAGNIKLFRLKEQYSIHTQELNDIIYKRRVFSDLYLRELQNNYPQLIKSFDDAYLLAFGKEFDLANDEKRPLSKFTRDIVDELGLIKLR